MADGKGGSVHRTGRLSRTGRRLALARALTPATRSRSEPVCRRGACRAKQTLATSGICSPVLIDPSWPPTTLGTSARSPWRWGPRSASA